MPGRRLVSGLQPEIRKKIAETSILASPVQMGKNRPNTEKSPETRFSSHFPNFRAIFFRFSRRSQSRSLSGFFPISGRRPEISLPPGTLDGPNRQSPIASVQAIPQVHVERILHQRTPIARFKSQRNECRVHEDQILCF